jgi:hypothetical protein
MCRRNDLAPARLRAAIAATFDRRKTAISPHTACFTSAFAEAKEKEWRALLRKLQVAGIPDDLGTVIRDIRMVVDPIFEELRADNANA